MKSVIVICVSLLAGPLGVAMALGQMLDSDYERALVTSGGIKIISRSEQVTVARLEWQIDTIKPIPLQADSKEKTLGPEEAKQMKLLLSSKSTYAGELRAVEPVPEFRIRFQQKNNRVDVLINYAASEAIIKVNGKVTGHLYIDPAFKKLAKLALANFPNSQSLRKAIEFYSDEGMETSVKDTKIYTLDVLASSFRKAKINDRGPFLEKIIPLIEADTKKNYPKKPREYFTRLLGKPDGREIDLSEPYRSPLGLVDRNKKDYKNIFCYVLRKEEELIGEVMIDARSPGPPHYYFQSIVSPNN